MTTKTFIFEVEVDEKTIAKKYPNYRFNFNTIEEFMNFLMCTIPVKNMRKFGYNINQKKHI